MEAIKKYLRSIALWKHRMKVVIDPHLTHACFYVNVCSQERNDSRTAGSFLHFRLSQKFEFHRPVRELNMNTRARYVGILKGMFAGDFGLELQRACAQFGLESTDLLSLPFSKLKFFERLQLYGKAPNKYFCTYLADIHKAKSTLRHLACINRCGSNAIVNTSASACIAMRIQALFTIPMEIQDITTSQVSMFEVPFMAGE